MKNLEFRAYIKALVYDHETRTWQQEAMVVPVLGLNFETQILTIHRKLSQQQNPYNALEKTETIPFDSAKVMQYSGVKDRLSNKIFDGDILEDANGYRAIVELNHHGITLNYSGHNAYPTYAELMNSKVLGNIHLNIELLNTQHHL